MKTNMIVAALVAAVALSACSREKKTQSITTIDKAPVVENTVSEKTELAKDLTGSRWAGACSKIESSFFDPNPQNYTRMELSFGAEDNSLKIKRVEYNVSNCAGAPVSESVVADKGMISITQSEAPQSGSALDGKIEIFSTAVDSQNLESISYRVIVVGNLLSVWKAETSQMVPLSTSDDSGQERLLGTEHEFTRIVFYPQSHAI